MSKELYALTFKETDEIVTPDSFKEYWKNYGSGGSGLHGWRPPKKVYYTEGDAKRGFAHVPDQLKPNINISKFVFGSIVIDGAKLFERQKKRKDKKEKERQEREAKRKLKQAKQKFLNAKLALEDHYNINYDEAIDQIREEFYKFILEELEKRMKNEK